MPFFGGSKSESDSKTKFNQNVWDQQSPFLTSLFGQAGDLFGSTFGQQQQMSPEVIGQMQNVFGQLQAPWQQQMRGGAYADVNASDIISGINRSIGQPTETGRLYGDIMGGTGNVYLGGMQDMMRRNEADVLADQMRSLDSRAAAAGMGGASTYRNLQRGMMDDSATRLGDRMTNLGFGTFDRDLDRKLNIAQMADQNTLARQQMLTDMLGQKQAAMSGGLGFGQNLYQMPMGMFAPSMMPWQAMNQYANIIGRPLVLGSGVSRGDSSSGGIGFGL